MSQKLKTALFALVALLILYCACRLMIDGSGGNHKFYQVFLLMILMMICNSSKKAFYFFIIPIAILYTIYAPFGLTYGAPRYEYLISIFTTDFSEGTEFLKEIKIVYYFYAICIIPLLLIFRYLTTRFELYFYKNKTVLIVFIVFAMINPSPTDFFKNSIKAIKEVKTEREKIKLIKKQNNWGNSTQLNSTQLNSTQLNSTQLN